MFTELLGRKLSLFPVLCSALFWLVLLSRASEAASDAAVQTASFASQAISTLSSALAWGIGASFTYAAFFLAACLVSFLINRS